MSIDELEAEALKLHPKSRAQLAERLLASLEDLTEEENAVLWAEEAARRDADMAQGDRATSAPPSSPKSGRPFRRSSNSPNLAAFCPGTVCRQTRTAPSV